MGRGGKKKTVVSGSSALHIKKKRGSGVMGSSLLSETSRVFATSDGSREWRNGKKLLDRKSGPARIFPDGREEWWRDGLLHRLDGPARIFPDGREEWWIDGRKRLYYEGHFSLSRSGFKEWLNENSDVHREDGPARLNADGEEEWYKEGKLHRLGGPAVSYREERPASGVFEIKEWYVDGERHRDSGPAVEHSDGLEVWYKKGKKHRDSGPAVSAPDGALQYYQEDILHREDGPARIFPDGREVWYKRGLLHREDGPAILYPRGRYIGRSEEWYKDNMLHREDGPARALMSQEKDEVLSFEWRKGGKLHRVDGPAVVRDDGFQAWYQNGALHREDGPAVILPDGRAEWWEEGLLVKTSYKVKDEGEICDSGGKFIDVGSRVKVSPDYSEVDSVATGTVVDILPGDSGEPIAVSIALDHFGLHKRHIIESPVTNAADAYEVEVLGG